ncbi:hypothetical protein D9M68_923830 [compost metagenome]
MFCITRSLMPSMSSSLVTARLLLVRLRKPFSQYTRPTRPFSCSLSITFWPTGPSSTASASLALLNRKGVSQIAISLVMPTSVAVEPTIISWAPPISALCIWSSEPRLAAAKVRIFSLPSEALATSSANSLAALPWLLFSLRP